MDLTWQYGDPHLGQAHCTRSSYQGVASPVAGHDPLIFLQYCRSLRYTGDLLAIME